MYLSIFTTFSLSVKDEFIHWHLMCNLRCNCEVFSNLSSLISIAHVLLAAIIIDYEGGDYRSLLTGFRYVIFCFLYLFQRSTIFLNCTWTFFAIKLKPHYFQMKNCIMFTLVSPLWQNCWWDMLTFFLILQINCVWCRVGLAFTLTVLSKMMIDRIYLFQ